MINAFTKPGRDDQWPFPVLAVPRGLREYAWTAALIIVAVTTLLLPAGWYFLLGTVSTTWLLGPWPRQMLAAAALIAATAIAAGIATGNADGIPRLLVQMFTHNISATASIPMALAAFSVHMAMAMVTVAIVLAYDTRQVTRGVVPEALWQRQQQRRIQVLRHEADSRPPPLVAP